MGHIPKSISAQLLVKLGRSEEHYQDGINQFFYNYKQLCFHDRYSCKTLWLTTKLYSPTFLLFFHLSLLYERSFISTFIVTILLEN